MKSYTHIKSGNTYLLIGISNKKATKPGHERTAFYVDLTGELWSKPEFEFAKKFKLNAQGN